MTQRIAVLLLLVTGLANGQNVFSLDLSGEWRKSVDDRPEYAQADFDDSAWTTVRLPWTTRPADGVWWLRRTVQLPAGTDRTRLALTLGAVAEAYEVHINGRLVAKAAGFSFAEAEIARPRTFRLPAIDEERVSIAIRQWRPNAARPGTARWVRFREGPYMLQTSGLFPADYGDLLMRKRQTDDMPDLVVSGLQLLLALIVLVFWLSDRRETHLLWLVLYAAADAMLTATGILLASPDAHPWFYQLRNVALASVRAALLAGFVISLHQLNRWWLHGLVWFICLMASAIRALEWREAYVLTSNLQYIAIVAAVLLGWKRQQTDSSPLMRHGMALLLLALCFMTANRTGLQFGFTGTVKAGGFSLSVAVALSAVLILLLLAIVLRRFLQQRQRLASELEAARTVQQLLLPASTPANLEAVYLPAAEVGGDFWHVFDNRLIVVGDVSGKGLKAAMIVSLVTGALRNRRSDEPAAILAELNAVLLGSPGFVTCCIARIDGDNLTLANAGHPSPYLDGRELELTPGLPLGIAPDANYDEVAIPLTGSLTFLSDGVIEAANAQGELFGFDRTRELSTQSAQEIADAAKQWGQNDDITVVTVRRTQA